MTPRVSIATEMKYLGMAYNE